MKKLIALLAFLPLALIAADQVVKLDSKLTWTDPNPVGLVTGYNVLRKDGENWVKVATVTTNLWPVTLPAGRHTIAVTAVAGELESDLSESLDLLRILAVIDVQLKP